MAARVLRDKVFAASAVAFVVLSSLTLWQVAETERNVDTLNSDLDTTEQRLDTAQERGTVLEDAQAEATRQARALLRQVRRHGLDPVVDPGEINPPADTSPMIIEGEPGPPAPPEDILAVMQAHPELFDAAFRRHCQDVGCQGRPGKDLDLEDALAAITTYCNNRLECIGETGDEGPPGPPPSDAQLTAILVVHCSTRNECVGDQGPQGQPGQDATDEQIAARVEAYCARDTQPCRGPKGDTGDQGPSGVVNIRTLGCEPADGQYIASVDTSYDPDSRTITVMCTKADDESFPTDES